MLIHAWFVFVVPDALQVANAVQTATSLLTRLDGNFDHMFASGLAEGSSDTDTSADPLSEIPFNDPRVSQKNKELVLDHRFANGQPLKALGNSGGLLRQATSSASKLALYASHSKASPLGGRTATAVSRGSNADRFESDDDDGDWGWSVAGETAAPAPAVQKSEAVSPSQGAALAAGRRRQSGVAKSSAVSGCGASKQLSTGSRSSPMQSAGGAAAASTSVGRACVSAPASQSGSGAGPAARATAPAATNSHAGKRRSGSIRLVSRLKEEGGGAAPVMGSTQAATGSGGDGSSISVTHATPAGSNAVELADIGEVQFDELLHAWAHCIDSSIVFCIHLGAVHHIHAHHCHW